MRIIGQESPHQFVIVLQSLHDDILYRVNGPDLVPLAILWSDLQRIRNGS